MAMPRFFWNDSTRPKLRKTIVVAAWAYLAVVVALWMVLRLTSETWWLATVFLFGPRWVCALPAAVLIPAALLARRRSVWLPVAASVLVVAGPLMGLCVPWRLAVTGGGTGTHLRVLTCNTHGDSLDVNKMSALIDQTQPDIVAMQEWNSGVEPNGLGVGPWHTLIDGELRLQSRFPVRREEEILSGGQTGAGNAVIYEVQTPAGGVRLLNLHLASPHNALSSAVRFRTDAADDVNQNAAERVREAEAISLAARQGGRGVILCGDFNMPCDSSGYRQNLTMFRDAFSVAGWGFGWTYHHSGTATRIDHVLAGADWNCRRCWVGPSVGSPHLPLIAEFIWQGQ